MIYFTSDLHLGHIPAIEFTHRPYKNIEEMNRILIQNINDTVEEDDELWILGDFAMKTKMKWLQHNPKYLADQATVEMLEKQIGQEKKKLVRDYRGQIKCRNVHLVRGNHDLDYSEDGIFQSVDIYKDLPTKYGRFILFHYPIADWAAAHQGSVHLHGHIHSTGEYNAANLQKKFKDCFPRITNPEEPDRGLRIYDVGVDANGYRPVSLERIAELMNLKRSRQLRR